MPSGGRALAEKVWLESQDVLAIDPTKNHSKAFSSMSSWSKRHYIFMVGETIACRHMSDVCAHKKAKNWLKLQRQLRKENMS